MKGLLIKDLLGLKKYYRTVLILCVFYVVLTFTMNSFSMIGGMVTLLMAMIPIAAFSYDEMAKWDIFGLSLPVTRQQVVLSRYLLAALFAGAGILFSLLVSWVYLLVKGGVWQEQMAIVLTCGGFGLLLVSVLIPLIYKLGAEKARFAMMAVVVLGVMLILLGDEAIKRAGPVLTAQLIRWAPVCAPVLLAAVFVGSFFLSCRIYEKKEI
ncbi:MAG TPA: ABC-2 transporter permease [Candidatus Gallacutalibacter stercoravium]|nr:ABC-2 transporter permease [Candidatus Gallacutalibacter stercoravium]